MSFLRSVQARSISETQRDFVDTGLINYVFQDFPLSAIHPTALKASQAASCAERQGRFWEMHEILFGQRPPFDQANLGRAASALNLDTTAFSACLASATADRAEASQEQGRRLGVKVTPSFAIATVGKDDLLIATKRVDGGQTFDSLKTALEDSLLSLPAAGTSTRLSPRSRR